MHLDRLTPEIAAGLSPCHDGCPPHGMMLQQVKAHKHEAVKKAVREVASVTA